LYNNPETPTTLARVDLRRCSGVMRLLRNIIAERVLGLAPELGVCKDVPFKDIPTGG
jgi:hypothetical protein